MGERPGGADGVEVFSRGRRARPATGAEVALGWRHEALHLPRKFEASRLAIACLLASVAAPATRTARRQMQGVATGIGLAPEVTQESPDGERTWVWPAAVQRLPGHRYPPGAPIARRPARLPADRDLYRRPGQEHLQPGGSVERGHADWRWPAAHAPVLDPDQAGQRFSLQPDGALELLEGNGERSGRPSPTACNGCDAGLSANSGDRSRLAANPRRDAT